MNTKTEMGKCRVELQSCINSSDTGFPVVPSCIIKNNESWEAKSIIESTLLKTAEILSEFTENTISQTNGYFDKILAPEAFGFKANPATTQINEKTKTDVKSNVSCAAPARRKPDITKLPSNIVDILREDSNSSIPSMNKSKKYHYHSKKMALKQRDDSSKEKVHVPLTTSKEKVVPNITLVSTPLTLQATESLTMENNNMSQASNFHKEFGITKLPPTVRNSKVQSFVLVPPTKTEKRITPNMSSVLRKSEKINLGVDNGVVFILGKTKSPYFNTFGETYLDHFKDASFNRKWVVNIGNFLDNEISLVLVGNTLMITGFRQPSLSYPDGQSVSEAVPVPSEIDVNNLRISRSKDAKAFLVIQEKTLEKQ